MKRPFVKMHGLGNDYIYFDCFEETIEAPSALAVRLSDRRFSVGGDGIVLILRSEAADAKMRMFNADGSEGKMCGNALRCVGKYLRDFRGVTKETVAVETLSGIRTVRYLGRGERGTDVFRADMGSPVFDPARIPMRAEGERAVDLPLEAGGNIYRVTCLSMGNPHCVVFTEELASLDLQTLGPLFEHHPAFPERVNTEFVRRTSDGLEMRVWERGSGETFACGTGACAAAVAARLNGLCGDEVAVRLKGGSLNIRYAGGNVFMTGAAEVSFTGEIEL